MLAAHQKKIKKAFKISQNVLPTIALFLISMSILLTGSDTLQKLDAGLALAQQNQKSSLTLSEIAGVTKKAEPKIISHNLTSPSFSAVSVLVSDFSSGQILYQKNNLLRYPPASTTKLMSSLVAAEHFKFDDVLTVTNQSLAAGSSMGLKMGEKLTFRSLLYGMLLDSGNDASYTIAANYPGGVDNFVTQMNLKASQMGLKDTHFQNPAGFDDPYQYTSADDLAKIAKVTALNNEISKVVATRQTTIISWNESTATSSAHLTHVLKNLNQLLNLPGVLGMKTGTTEKAGENLVGLVERDGQKVITVMLGSKDRFLETKNLIDWVYNNYSWQ